MVEGLGYETRNVQYRWRNRRVHADRTAAPKCLWHYTDAQGLMGILQHEEVWATNTRFLNDLNELEYGLHIVRDTIFKVLTDQEWNPATSSFLKNVVRADGINLTEYLRARSDIYVACFCEQGDLLSQWRAYAGSDDFGGYALKFQPYVGLYRWIDHLGTANLRLEKVIYEPAEQVRLISELITSLARIYENSPSEQQQLCVIESLKEGILEFAMFCKHPSFQEEKEWRVLYNRDNHSRVLPMNYRSSRGLIVPYVALDLRGSHVDEDEERYNIDFEPMPITEICVGPSPDPDLKKKGLQQFLNSTELFQNVKITGTRSPLRL